jgi:hypothetical protein
VHDEIKPSELLEGFIAITITNYLVLLILARPIKPKPKSASVLGSDTAVALLIFSTDKVCQFAPLSVENRPLL